MIADLEKKKKDLCHAGMISEWKVAHSPWLLAGPKKLSTEELIAMVEHWRGEGPVPASYRRLTPRWPPP
jgi:hypothetical protein